MYQWSGQKSRTLRYFYGVQHTRTEAAKIILCMPGDASFRYKNCHLLSQQMFLAIVLTSRLSIVYIDVSRSLWKSIETPVQHDRCVYNQPIVFGETQLELLVLLFHVRWLHVLFCIWELSHNDLYKTLIDKQIQNNYQRICFYVFTWCPEFVNLGLLRIYRVW